MSETKLATKADLKEMYDRILHYMGGMPEMLANKFSKGDLYSTDEKMIGQWIDGKPLYQKTLQITTNTTSSTKTISTGIANIDKIVEYNGFIRTDSQVIPMNTYWAANEANVIFTIASADTTMVVKADYSEWHGKTAFITIKYTKTSDSAVSIGDETDYSTTEKIVGTWIDGKPIWQKTFTGTVDAYSSITNKAIGASVDKVVDVRGIMGNYVSLIGMTNDAMNAGIAFSVLDNSDASNPNTFMCYCKPSGQSAFVGRSYYVTIQYTKTTS